MKNTIYFLLLASIQLFAANPNSKNTVKLSDSKQLTNQSKLIYLNADRLQKVKSLIEKKDTFFTNAYRKLIVEADRELTKTPNPVTNKSQLPPSGDKQDYLSMAPYWWPNPNTADGFPWILKDGEINPMTRDDNNDQGRLKDMFGSLNELMMAYYFSGDVKYAEKARSIIKIWFIDDATKVNPNVNFGQGVPRVVEGRRAGIIEWVGSSKLITASQLLTFNNLLSASEKQSLNSWISDYYKWLKTSSYGIENDNGKQNHSTCYDYQMVGIALYLGLNDEARERVEAAKIKRICTQIKPDGTQPAELGRTKSMHYSSMNLITMTYLAEMGKKLGVDLFNYTSNEGNSMRNAYKFLRPFAQGEMPWTYKQITPGGAEQVIEDELKPTFSIGSTIFGEDLIDPSAQVYKNLSYMERLQFPPLFKISSAKSDQTKTKLSFLKEITNLPSLESVIYDAKTNLLYVSIQAEKGIKDGSIATLSLDGVVKNTNFTTGLIDPKGMAIVENRLYVSDVMDLVEIDIKTGKILKKYSSAKVQYFNDVTADKKGNVYVSDMHASSIYKLDKQKNFTEWIASPELESPNGLLAVGTEMVIGGWGYFSDGQSLTAPKGHLLKMDMKTKKISKITPKPLGNIDGIQLYGKNSYIVSDWKDGKVMKVYKNGTWEEMLDTERGAADFVILAKKKLLILPLNKQNKLAFYQINQLK